MSITDELRKWAQGLNTYNRNELQALAIADRIDAEYEKAMSRAGQLLADTEMDRDCNYANWQDCKQKVLQGNITMGELSAEIERLKDELAHRIEPPKDADGEVIHVGDELRDAWNEQNQGEVEWLMLDHHGWWLRLKTSCERFYVHEFHEWHHRHAPTVEDVLRDFARECLTYATCVDDHEVQDAIEMYAAKLQLRGDAE